MLQSDGGPADRFGTGRSLSLVSLVLALALSGLMLRAQLGGTGRDGAPTPAEALTQARGALLAAQLLQASAVLEQFHAERGTYAGAPLAAGVELVRADEISYCIQAPPGAPAVHQAGSSAAPAAGGC